MKWKILINFEKISSTFSQKKNLLKLCRKNVLQHFHKLGALLNSGKSWICRFLFVSLKVLSDFETLYERMDTYKCKTANGTEGGSKTNCANLTFPNKNVETCIFTIFSRTNTVEKIHPHTRVYVCENFFAERVISP